MTREHAADDATRQFRRLLERMFRLDCADLDFGVYRVLAQRRAQLEALLDEGLLPQVQRALASTDADAREVFGPGGDTVAERSTRDRD